MQSEEGRRVEAVEMVLFYHVIFGPRTVRTTRGLVRSVARDEGGHNQKDRGMRGQHGGKLDGRKGKQVTDRDNLVEVSQVSASQSALSMAIHG